MNLGAFSISFVIGHSISPVQIEKIESLAAKLDISTDEAWLNLVHAVVDELSNESSPTSMSSILSHIMDKEVHSPRLLLGSQNLKENGIIRKHPVLTFEYRYATETENDAPVEITRQHVDTIAETLKLILDVDFIEIIYQR